MDDTKCATVIITAEDLVKLVDSLIFNLRIMSQLSFTENPKAAHLKADIILALAKFNEETNGN
jgi:hypothetical protein